VQDFRTNPDSVVSNLPLTGHDPIPFIFDAPVFFPCPHVPVFPRLTLPSRCLPLPYSASKFPISTAAACLLLCPPLISFLFPLPVFRPMWPVSIPNDPQSPFCHSYILPACRPNGVGFTYHMIESLPEIDVTGSLSDAASPQLAVSPFSRAFGSLYLEGGRVRCSSPRQSLTSGVQRLPHVARLIQRPCLSTPSRACQTATLRRIRAGLPRPGCSRRGRICG